MGGRKKMKKKILDKDRKEASVFSNYSAPARNLRKKDLGAVIFGCKHNTINECLSNQLFGLPASHFSYIKNISQGLVLFLFNYSDRQLHGIFEAATPGQMNINRYAWIADEDNSEYTSYPAQVRVRVKLQCQPLPENHYQPIIATNYYENKHFYFELDHDQTNKLISLFTSSPVNSSASSSRRWNNLPSSLPVPTKRQADNAMQIREEEASFDHGEQANRKGSSWDAPLSPGISTNLLQPTMGMVILAENLNQTSRLSYASVLSKSNTTIVTTATSSLPTGKWSALFEDQSAFEATNNYECRFQTSNLSYSASDVPSTIPESSWATNSPADQSVQVYENQRDEVVARNHDRGGFEESPQNQEYEDKSDSSQENTWEDSQLVATTTDVECVQTWESHLSPQANTTTDELMLHQENEDKANNLQANIWGESHPEHLNESSSSSQPLDDNTDCKQSLSNKTNESDGEEKHESSQPLVPNTVAGPSTHLESLVAKLMQEVEVLKGSQLKQIVRVNKLEQELDESKLEIQWLRNRLGFLESGSPSIVDPAEVDDQLLNKCSKFVDSIFIVGGYDGSTWLSTLDSYLPSHDIKSSLSPMNFVKKYASAATLNGELYHFGGIGSHMVESFNPTKNQWVSRPPLYWKNIQVAGASVIDKLFVVGGGNGRQCSSEVEYLDLNIGKWLPAQPMQSKRFAPAAAELNNALYVAGGYDGVSYVSSVERFDPREKAWHTLSSMNTRKGCHSLVVLNEKLYTVGGFDGDKYIPTVESFDARMGSWVDAEPMNVSRGNFGAVVVGEKLYTIGGVKENNEILDIVEFYKEGSCWEIADLKAIGKRRHFSAIVL